ncbi:retropepsin-like aspartic protease [Sphingomonas sp. RB3P16]|uniref:retropepsin-like aspartic protease n=1 Tax=Parasphingomonas frigoris TaxID=3096163 RepID=UPI002FCA58CA
MTSALFLLVPFLGLATPVQAGPVPGPIATPDVAQHDPQQTPLDQLAFTDDGTRMTVPVTIGPAGPYRFVVDTGAERTVISHELATTLGLAVGSRVRVTAMSGSSNVGTYVVPEIIVGSPRAGARLTGSRIEAPALQAGNLGAAGLVGIDTLQGHAVTIDFATRTMTVTPSVKRTRTERFGPDDIVIRARNLFGQLVVTDADYRGRKIRVVIDTGAVISMGNLALLRLVRSDAQQMQPISLLSVTGGVLQADFRLVDQIHVAAIGFKDLPVAFSDAPPFARLGLHDRPALLLGMDAMRLFGRVRIDFANRELRLAQPTPDPR